MGAESPLVRCKLVFYIEIIQKYLVNDHFNSVCFDIKAKNLNKTNLCVSPPMPPAPILPKPCTPLGQSVPEDEENRSPIFRRFHGMP